MSSQLPTPWLRMKSFLNEHLIAWGRVAIVFGIWLRFLAGEYSIPYNILWVSTLVLFSVYALWVALSVLQHPSLKMSRSWNQMQVILDVILISTIYFLSTHPNSDFFLIYFLPLVISAEHFKFRAVLSLLGLISVLYGVLFLILTYFSADNPTTTLTIWDSLLRNLIPRWFFFSFILFLAFTRQLQLKSRNEELEAVHQTLKTRNQELEALHQTLKTRNEELEAVHQTLGAKNEELEAVHQTAIKIADNEAMEERLKAIMDAATAFLHAKGCKVYLCVPNQELLQLVALTGIEESEVLKPGYLLPFGKGMAGAIIDDNLPYLIENDYRHSKYRMKELEKLFEAVIEVPLSFGDSVIGVLGVFDNRRNRVFTDQDVPVLKRLAQYAAVAIHDMQLVQKVQKQTQALQMLIAAGQTMNATLDPDKTDQAIAENVWRLVTLYGQTPPLFASLTRLTQDGRCLRVIAAYPQERLPDLLAHHEQDDLLAGPVGIIGKAVKDGIAQLVPDVKQEPAYVLFDSSTVSQLAVPIKNGRGEVIGAISVEHTDHHALTEEVQQNLEVLAVQATAAIENARLFKEIERQGKQAKSLLEINPADGLVQVAEGILEALQGIVPYSRATLQIIEDDTRHILAKRGLADDQVDPFLARPISQDPLLQEILSQREIRVLSVPENNQHWQALDTTSDIKSWIGIPLVYGELPIGFITMDQIQKGFYTEEHKTLLDLFAHHTTSVLQNAILFQQNAQQVEQLTQAMETLENALEFFESYRNLALIGLVYGETIHYAKNQLGMAGTRAADIARGYVDSAEKIKEDATKIGNYIKRYLQVLDETQRVALESPEHGEIDIHQLLDELIATKRMGSRIQVRRAYGASRSIVRAPKQLRQVFLVIIQNALEAMDGEGILGLETVVERRKGLDFIRVSISDTGKGIPESVQSVLFIWRARDPEQPRRRGTGLGLPWAYSFLRVYKGDIEFTTTPGQGTTMHIFVPDDFRKELRVPFAPDDIRKLIARLKQAASL